MRTKLIETKTGTVILYFNEVNKQWTRFKEEALDVFHEKIIEGTCNKARTIRQFYSKSTDTHTRNKIREMVNHSDAKFNLLYETIINIRG